MYMLRYKIPLEVILNNPIEKNGYKVYEVKMSDLKFNDINLNEIKNLGGQELVKGDYEQVDVAWNNDFDFIARHFFELGFKAQKGE